ncbi:hypothetical protein B484DRAFT_288578 [Ochromonadaceae sp. CCMP2298]|nr:hypothetical protein B484DRAFT_288578 [Ochromonadaceae sp. CCMP2298]
MKLLMLMGRGSRERTLAGMAPSSSRAIHPTLSHLSQQSRVFHLPQWLEHFCPLLLPAHPPSPTLAHNPSTILLQSFYNPGIADSYDHSELRSSTIQAWFMRCSTAMHRGLGLLLESSSKVSLLLHSLLFFSFRHLPLCLLFLLLFLPCAPVPHHSIALSLMLPACVWIG